jgi:hypothetical protein
MISPGDCGEQFAAQFVVVAVEDAIRLSKIVVRGKFLH